MKKSFRFEGLDCANCAAKIENRISKIEGVTAASVNFIMAKMVIEAPDGLIDDVCAQAEKIARSVSPDIIIKRA
ncbi:MAG: cation transporter [Angelakisella sp.]